MNATSALQNRAETTTPGYPRRQPWLLLLIVAPFVVAISFLAWIWLGLILHYRVPAVSISDEVIEATRLSPPDSTFVELAKLHATAPPWKTDGEAIRLADDLLAGRTITLTGNEISLGMALAPDRADQVPLGSMLSLATMDPVQVLLRAYQLGGNDQYLARARDIILSFDSWDRHAWMPKGLAWNDHAVAARVQVLTDFWGAYRHSTLYDRNDARRILELAARGGRRLADDRNFNVATNHGVMQNISLLELAIAFPNLPGTAEYRDIALRRLNTQMNFYVSDEGVVLEHSAFYHQFGLRLLAVAGRMMQMLDVPIPEAWNRKYRLAQGFYTELQRPDGTLPQFGDTSSEPQTPFVLESGTTKSNSTNAPQSTSSPVNGLTLYPASGYSISWEGVGQAGAKRPVSQMVITWSDFPSESHKHADDLSVLVWADGESWWTNVGYWPYGDPARHAAESWNGSNAPHLANEPAEAPSGTLLATASSGALRFVDVERVARGSVVLRRQVVELLPARWIVIDSTTGSGDRVFTSWNSAADVSVRDEGNDCYRLTSSAVVETMRTCLTAGTPLKSAWLRGSDQPFAGWQVVDHRPVPANALLVEQETGSWVANTFELLKDGAQPSMTPSTVQWQGPERWTLELADGTKLSRDGNDLRLAASRQTNESVILKAPGAETREGISKIRDHYFEALRQYPKFNESYALRRKLTLLLVVCLAASMGALLIVRRAWSQLYVRAVSLLAILWFAGALTLLLRFKSIF